MVQIVAVQRRVEDANRHGVVPDAGKNFREPRRQMIAADRNADEHDLGTVLVALGDLMRDARERALDGGGVEDDGGFRHKKSRIRSAGRS